MEVFRDLPSGLRRANMPPLPQKWRAFAWTPKGEVSVSSPHGIFVWKPGGEQSYWTQVSQGEAGEFAWSSDGKWLAFVDSDFERNQSTIHVVDVVTLVTTDTVALKGDCFALAVSSSAAGEPTLDIGAKPDHDSPGQLLYWSRRGRGPAEIWGDRPEDLWSVSNSPRGGILATGYQNGAVALDGPELTQLRILHAHSEEVRDFAWSPDGSRLASGSNDGLVCIWDIARGELIHQLEEPSGGGALTVSFSHDGALLASASPAGALGLWSTKDWQAIDLDGDYPDELMPYRAEFSPTDPFLLTQFNEDPAEELLALLDVSQLIDAPPPKFASPPSQSDEPSHTDHFGRGDLVRAIAAMIEHEDQGTPFSIGIFGDWGAGKSSVLRQLVDALGKHSSKRFYVADFNAWEHEHTDNIAAGLAQCVVKSLTQASRSGSVRLRCRFAFARNRTEIAVGLGLFVLMAVLLANLYASGGGANFLAEVGGFGSVAAFAIYAFAVLPKVLGHPITSRLRSYLNLPDYGKQLGLVPELQRDIKDLCALVLREQPPSELRRLVVLVDDLDRCTHGTVVSTLEAVRLVMDQPGVVVILALDPRIALQAVAHRYREQAAGARSAEDMAREYLGKIIQLPITLEEPTSESLSAYVRNVLFEGVASPSSSPKIVERVVEVPRSDQGIGTDTGNRTTANSRDKVFREPAKIQSLPDNPAAIRLEHTSAEVKQFEDLIQRFRIDNPRRLLRLRNSYRVAQVLRPTTGPATVMNMLFWQEHLYGSQWNSHIAMEDTFRKSSSTGGIDSAGKELIKWARTAFTETDGYEVLACTIRRFVLPRLIPHQSQSQTEKTSAGVTARRNTTTPKKSTTKRRA